MSGGEYVALAYGAVLVFVVAYVAIIAAKLARLQQQTHEILELARRDEPAPRSVEAVTHEVSQGS